MPNLFCTGSSSDPCCVCDPTAEHCATFAGEVWRFPPAREQQPAGEHPHAVQGSRASAATRHVMLGRLPAPRRKTSPRAKNAALGKKNRPRKRKHTALPYMHGSRRIGGAGRWKLTYGGVYCCLRRTGTSRHPTSPCCRGAGAFCNLSF